MLVDTPQIIWHGGEAGKNSPVLSLDTHPFPLDGADDDGGSRFVLATAGTDAEVRLWLVNQPTEKDEEHWEQPELSGRLQSFVASLEGHQRGVNVVRFSPDGLSLASASDGGTVVVWRVGAVGSWSMLKSDRETTKTILRAATEDIYDIAWSPDSKYLACGSIDRRAHVWEVATKRSIAVLEDHQNYVQGTAWDPLSKYMATQSSDRSCRVYQLAQDGASGVAGVGRVTVKCCNVIKSCIVTPDEGGVGISACGERANQGDTPVQDATFSEGTTCATGPEASPATSTLTQTEGGDTTCTQAAAAALDCSESKALGVTDVAAPATAVDTAADAPGTGGGGKGGGSGTCTLDADTTRDKTKTNPVQRKNLFVDETVTSFFRRLSWSPDGAFLITPTAQYWDATTKKTQFCTYLFTRGQFVKPAVCLPGLNKPSVAVRCNPRLFCLKGRHDEPGDVPEEAPMCDLPYRVVFAVVTLDAVVVYDTEHPHPLTVATGLHYSGLTDACWSSDGLSLFVSSTDGYVSKIHFTREELGAVIPESDVPLQTKRLHPVIYGSPEEALRVNDSQCRIPKPSLPSVADVRGPAECHGSTPGKGEVADGIVPAEALGQASNPHVLVAKPKKKIVPTLIKSLPAAASGRHPEVDIGQVTLPSTSVPPSPTPATDGVVGEKKKRRITPTLVQSNVDTAHAQGADGDVDPSARDEMSDTHMAGDGAPRDPPSVTKHASGKGQDRTPKKKRLAPTLVSAL